MSLGICLRNKGIHFEYQVVILCKVAIPAQAQEVSYLYQITIFQLLSFVLFKIGLCSTVSNILFLEHILVCISLRRKQLHTDNLGST
jgi:hypothetical protein